MSTVVERLLELLDLEPIEVNIFRGISPADSWQRVFGGQVLGQALVAATRTVGTNSIVHSLHAYFLRPGDPKIPILYEVERTRDGRSFTTRRVVAIQHGRPIFNMSASFHFAEEGFDHHFDMPEAPPPEGLKNMYELRQEISDKIPSELSNWWSRERPIEIRPVTPRDHLNPSKLDPQQSVWVRACEKLPDDVSLHQCILAYASDMTLLDTSLMPHAASGALDPTIQMASLDHAMWFHRPFRADEWLLYVQDSPSAYGSRGFNRGSLFTREGVLIASVAQEGLIRRRTKNLKKKPRTK